MTKRPKNTRWGRSLQVHQNSHQQTISVYFCIPMVDRMRQAALELGIGLSTLYWKAGCEYLENHSLPTNPLPDRSEEEIQAMLEPFFKKDLDRERRNQKPGWKPIADIRKERQEEAEETIKAATSPRKAGETKKRVFRDPTKERRKKGEW